MKGIYKGGVKENIKEKLREIFLMNTISKLYESVLKMQNENNNDNMSQMQTMDTLIILNSII